MTPDSSGSLDTLPVTGLAAAPMALAGLALVVFGTLGMRRFSPAEGSDRAEDVELNETVSADDLRPKGAVAVLDRPTAAEADAEPSGPNDELPEEAPVAEGAPDPTVAKGEPTIERADSGAAPRRPAAGYAPIEPGRRAVTPGRVAGAAMLAAGAIGARHRIGR